MITTGHDFPNLTLVGVLNADTGLHRSDFRAAETTFQLLTQVAGRPGRAHKPGEVLVQTYNADHYAIFTAARHDFLAFYATELEQRREALYPPFVSMVRLVVSSEDQAAGWAATGELGVALKRHGVYDTEPGTVPAENVAHFLGPAECALRKLRGKYRFSLLLKGQDREELAHAVQAAAGDCRLPDDVFLSIDVDPLNMM
jgi:primosomal protein N' (replication factor Y)